MSLNKINDLAPVVIFVYDRFSHAKKTLEALQKNNLAHMTNLIIYSDHYKQSNKNSVLKVRKLIKKYKKFKSVKIIMRKKNFGLADSIRLGITETFRKYDKAIFLEDDIVTGKYFLNFMNNCLIKYKNDKKIFHISSWNYPMIDYGLSDINFSSVMNCWGWATWRDRWNKVSFDKKKIYKNFSIKKIQKLNIDGYENFWFTFLLNYKKKIKTWAIYWAIAIVNYDGLCIFPKNSFSQNIGMDGSGKNNFKKIFINPYLFKNKINNSSKTEFPKEIKENKIHKFYLKVFYFFSNNRLLTLFNRLVSILVEANKNKIIR